MKKSHIHLKSPGIRTAIVLSVKFLPYKNIFTHYKNAKKNRLKKDQYVNNVHFKEFYW
jgi:hypothetical protein